MNEHDGEDQNHLQAHQAVRFFDIPVEVPVLSNETKQPGAFTTRLKFSGELYLELKIEAVADYFPLLF